MISAIEILFSIILVLIVLFVPGYCLTLAFWPRQGQVDFIERITFSFALSIIFIPLLMLIENSLLKIPINYFSVLATVIFLIAAGLVGWFIRKQKIDKKDLFPLIPKF